MTDAEYAKHNSLVDVNFALELMEADDPNRYKDIASVLRRAAGRYDYLAEVSDPLDAALGEGRR